VTLSLLVCTAALLALLYLLRRDGVSLGLPLAYMGALLLIHMPGAFANLFSAQPTNSALLVREGIRLTAMGAVSFVVGVWIAHYRRSSKPQSASAAAEHERAAFRVFCLFAGWLFVYGLAWTEKIPSVGAAVNKGGAIWSLGVLLGMAAALRARNWRNLALWLAALSVYPALSLLVDGFLSYGSTAVIIAGAVLAVCARRYWRAAAGIAIAAFIGITVFVNYFEHRDQIRSKVWGGASIDQRIDIVASTAKDFHWFNANNPADSASLDERLNQNYFVGLSVSRLRNGDVGYLKGRSVWEGLVSLVPRIVWPNKPVFGGSPKIVAEMTGLHLSTTTSWGVGNVMEFYCNFGVVGLVLGFLGLGWLIAWLDIEATLSERRGDFGRALLFFLPAVALIQPNGSIVELSSGAAAALIGAHLWRHVWIWRRSSRSRRAPAMAGARSSLGPA
jgi:hypothetical protein